MADEFQTSGSWWESSRNRFERGISPPSSALSSLGSFAFGWPPEMADMKARSSMESVSVSSSSSFVFHDTQKLQNSDSSAVHPNLQMMGLGLSPPTIDWNQSLLFGEKSDMSFRSMLQENMNSNSNFNQPSGPNQWRDRLFSGDNSSENEFKPENRGFSLDQQEFSAHDYSGVDTTATSLGLSSSFQTDSSALYGNQNTILQGFENQNQQNSYSMEFNYGANFPKHSNEFKPSSWSSSKVPQFLRALPPKNQNHHSLLHFSNNAPFWNASEAAIKDTKPSFFPSLQTQFYSQNFEEKPKQNISETRDSGTVIKRSGSQQNSKRPRSETPSPLPAFKVRKEKMGDRVTALQQLVSPFGKTDTASVLSEALDYIKFLYEQVSVLSTPYMKSGAAIQHQHNLDKTKETEGLKQDLRSRGLCLVPVSSTFPVTHENTVDFWTPTFGGTFR